MFKNIEKVKEAEKVIKNGILCFCEINEEKNGYKFSYLSKNIPFLESYLCRYIDYDGESGKPCNLISQHFVNATVLPYFQGQVYGVASTLSPKYGDYLEHFESEDYALNLERPIYSLEDFSVVTDLNPDIDEQGRLNGRFVVSNFSKEMFVEVDGMLLLSEKSGPKFISDDSLAIIDSDDFVSLGFEKDEEIVSHRAMVIHFFDKVVDIILLDDAEETSRFVFGEMDESEDNCSSYDNNVNVNSNRDSEELNQEIHDWNIMDDEVDLDDENEYEVSVSTINKKLEHDNMDDEIELDSEDL